MAIKYGIDFPFRESQEGHFLKMRLIDFLMKNLKANLAW
jgi:hypothetical protein